MNSDLGRYANTTYLNIAAGGISDMADNLIMAVVRPVDDHNADLIPPEVINFSLGLNNGKISLTFTKDVGSVLNSTGMIELF